jgi:hypothetical protein
MILMIANGKTKSQLTQCWLLNKKFVKDKPFYVQQTLVSGTSARDVGLV